MLPVARLIGHKEWTRRKSDPRHDMNWRRGRVANFRPRTAAAMPTPKPAPQEATVMRSVQLTDSTPAVLTVDAVGTSLVMPNGSRAWVQWQAFFPNATDKVALVDWLVFVVPGKPAAPVKPFELSHREVGALELPAGCTGVEIRVQNIPAGGVVGFHLDGLGHA